MSLGRILRTPDGGVGFIAHPVELSDDDPLAKAVLDARRAAYGDSNDTEIERLQDALDLALNRANVRVRDLTADEIEQAENSED